MAQTFETLRKYPGTSEKMLQKAIEQMLLLFVSYCKRGKK